MKYPILFILFLFSLNIEILIAQKNNDLVYVDESGILRWTENNSEASFFGVNYSSPFAYSYRTLKRLGIPIKKAIDIDVAHLARLGFNAYRIHVWDREVSDREGNLIENDHIENLDYLIHKLKERGIYIILTPIAWWGTGWPEPDLKTEGFSTFNSKVEMITKTETRKAQANYIKQFINHFNKYENLSYKDDPFVIAFEIINEPHHPDDTSLVSGYINEMVSVIRNEGVTKPIYYNISESWSEKQAAAVYNSNIQGISFQWYPTGLVKRSELKGNYLPHVDHYTIPQIQDKNFKNKTRMVYEFDAADIGGSFMYSAMARSFKEAGMQFAAMFSYDPLHLAQYNSEYQTHYANLLYTPQKALSLMIAGEIFRNIEAYKKFKSYPENLNFGDFRINHEENLSEMNSDEKFYYTNNTNSSPKNLNVLKHIAGYGSSQIIKTNSKGNYFLDKISDGVWRLEVYPDAIWLKDPFGINNTERNVAELIFNKSFFEINLPDLNKNFKIYCLTNKGLINSENKFEVEPGVYLLSNEEIKNVNDIKFSHNNIELQELYLPEKESIGTFILHTPKGFIFENSPDSVEINVYSGKQINEVHLYLRKQGWFRFGKYDMVKSGIDKYKYTTVLPKELVTNGLFEYSVSVLTDEDTLTFPGSVQGLPSQWDFESKGLWQMKVLPEKSAINLFNPEKDFSNIILPSIWDKVEFQAGVIYNQSGEPLYELKITKIKQPIDDFTFQIELDDKLKNINENLLKKYQNFYLNIEEDLNESGNTIFRFVDNNCSAKEFLLKNQERELAFNSFKKSDFVLLPRPYPKFLPYYFHSSDIIENKLLEINRINYLQITIPLKEGSVIRLGEINLIP